MSRCRVRHQTTLVERQLTRCCCNCRWMFQVMKHPENPITLGYGKMTERMGYGCMNPELSSPEHRRVVVFFVQEHGLCEGWQHQA